MSSCAVVVTDFGNLAVVGPAAVAGWLWLAWRGGPAAAWRFIGPVAVMFVLMVGLKVLFRLAGGEFVGTPFALSAGAPSGHAEMTAAVYGGLTLALLRRCRGPLCLLAAALTAILLVGVAVTRVTLRAHTPADVAVGLLIGGACAVWIARGLELPRAAPRRYAAELVALLVVVMALMQLSGVRIDSAMFI